MTPEVSPESLIVMALLPYRRTIAKSAPTQLPSKMLWMPILSVAPAPPLPHSGCTMIAAYLNESAFPNTFPADSLIALRTMWYAAVVGGDPALEQFHSDPLGREHLEQSSTSRILPTAIDGQE